MSIMPSNLTKNFWWLFALATLSFLPALFFYYVGEEAIFPISSLEMWQHGTWLKQYMYGGDMQHNPLFNWLIIPFSALAGWDHMLVITRALTICATLLTGLLVAWLAQRLFRDKSFAAFAALAYMTMADMLLYHGWLIYVDPLFAMFIFAAISTLWIGTLDQRPGLLVAAGILLTCAFLSKAFTAYIFYGTALFVLLFDARQRAFLLGWPALLIHAATFAAPLGWFALIPGGHSQSGRMFAEILQKLGLLEMGAYLTRLAMYPLEIFSWLSPITLLALYFWLRKRNRSEEGEYQRMFKTACWIALLEFLPYWFSPQGGMRYLLPIYPLLALVAARVVWQSGEAALVTACKWIIGVLVLKFIVALVIFPYYQSHYRGKNYDDAAADIMMLTQGYPLYSDNSSAAGLSVTAYLDQRRFPATAIPWPPAQWQSGYVLALGPDATLGGVYKKYQLGGDELYLLCRGEACAKPH
jgi:4-amino-4-deoxy-L-arabinose transferase-like glycosyltransferase